VAQGSLLLASPQQGVSPSRSIQQGTGGSWLHFRQTPAGLVLIVLTLALERCPFVQSPEMLWAGVQSSYLHGPKNWLVRTRTDL
jgi:hypothetical protein